VLVFPGFAAAYDGRVEKKVFVLPSFTTRNGSALVDVRFGYETYGHLNGNKDNAILIPPPSQARVMLPASSLRLINNPVTGTASSDPEDQ
jgi:hypothetical protein